MNEYETLLKVIRERRSIRRFSDHAVSRGQIEQLIEAARWAPSNHNRQPWRFLVLDDGGQIQALARAVAHGLAPRLKTLPAVAASFAAEFEHYATFFAGAPVLLIVLHRQPVSFAAELLQGVANASLVSGEPLSVAMAVQNLLLAAHALGLGACVLTAPMAAQPALNAALTLPAGYDITCFVAVGYPNESPPAPRRKSLEQIVEFNHDSRKTSNVP
jgi:coenzyme F420-0:L-glutamate ligase / coenzyme F420-1:gamma-L-glutamate ligase